MNLEAYKKDTLDSYSLLVRDKAEEGSDYFLMNRFVPGFLNFQWMKNGKSKASFSVIISSENIANSLPFAPFGGIWANENLSSKALEEFIQEVLKKLKEMGVKSLKIIQPPKPYISQSDLIDNLLSKNGFSQTGIFSHQFFLGKKKIKRFVQDNQSKYHLKEKTPSIKVKTGAIQNFNFLDEIKSWNSGRGYEVTFEEKTLIAQVSEFPDRYFLISILHGEKAIAHSVVVKPTKNSMYYFLSASDSKSQVKNLGGKLLFELFKLAVEHKIEVLDLGSSESNQAINHSLMFFKSRFSNDISNKVSWVRNLES